MICHAGCAPRVALSRAPAAPQAAYCRRYSPYPRFLSELLLWYMMSLLALFGAARPARARWLSGLTAALIPAGHFYYSKFVASRKAGPRAGGRKKAQ